MKDWGSRFGQALVVWLRGCNECTNAQVVNGLDGGMTDPSTASPNAK